MLKIEEMTLQWICEKFPPLSIKNTTFHPFFHLSYHKSTFENCQLVTHELSVFLEVEPEGNCDLSSLQIPFQMIARVLDPKVNHQGEFGDDNFDPQATTRPSISYYNILDHSTNNNIWSKGNIQEGHTCIIEHQPTRQHKKIHIFLEKLQRTCKETLPVLKNDIQTPNDQLQHSHQENLSNRATTTIIQNLEDLQNRCYQH